MLITIMGSWRTDSNSDTFDNFVEACEAIGRGLARAEQQVIVASEREHTADRHIVTGIVEEAARNRDLSPRIHIIRPREGDLFRDLRREYGRLFTQHGNARHSPEAATIISARDADAVLTIGGRKRTYRIGLSSIVAKKRLVPIGSFGGASLDLIDEVRQYGNITSRQIEDALGSLSAPWSNYVLDNALALAGVTKPPTILIIHGRSNDRDRLRLWSARQDVLPLDNLPTMGETWGDGRTLPEQFEALAAQVDGAIAIATPDDVGRLNEGDSSSYRQRARQNVWLEVGWFWGRLGRKRVMILRRGDIELPSDLQGIEFFAYTESPEEAGDKIREFIRRIRRGT
jgi:hypothetical protein